MNRLRIYAFNLIIIIFFLSYLKEFFNLKKKLKS